MNSNDYKKIGMRIRFIRTSKNLTQEQLAEIISTDHSVIARIESGKRFSLDFLIKLANALETSADAILLDCLECTGIDSNVRNISEILFDCSVAEISILTASLKSLRSTLKNFIIK